MVRTKKSERARMEAGANEPAVKRLKLSQDVDEIEDIHKNENEYDSVSESGDSTSSSDTDEPVIEEVAVKKAPRKKSPSKQGRQTAGARLGKSLLKMAETELLDKDEKEVKKMVKSKILTDANIQQAHQALTEVDILSSSIISAKQNKIYKSMDENMNDDKEQYQKFNILELQNHKDKLVESIHKAEEKLIIKTNKLFLIEYNLEVNKGNSPSVIMVKTQLENYISKIESELETCNEDSQLA